MWGSYVGLVCGELCGSAGVCGRCRHVCGVCGWCRHVKRCMEECSMQVHVGLVCVVFRCSMRMCRVCFMYGAVCVECAPLMCGAWVVWCTGYMLCGERLYV